MAIDDFNAVWAGLSRLHPMTDEARDALPGLIGSTAQAQITLARLAYRAYQEGRSAGIRELRSTGEAARELGVSPRRIHQLAAATGGGWEAGRGVRVFTPEDIANMRAQQRRPGRPILLRP